jgi:LacI family repressor for deo operon, udp, cdd, tsx, nupC, and nupG
MEYIDLLAGKQVDGIIICGTCLNEEKLSQVAARIPLSVSAACKPKNTAVVNIQVEEGMYRITSHLIHLGHRQIGYLSDTELDQREPRFHGFRRALQEHCLPMNMTCRHATANTVESGRQHALRLLQQYPVLSVIVCNGGSLAIGAIRVCQESDRRVPQDVAITGFDDIKIASLSHPFLTTMRVPRRQLGELLAKYSLRRYPREKDMISM